MVLIIETLIKMEFKKKADGLQYSSTTLNLDSCPEGALIGMGNPLLDISAHVPHSLLDKYEVKAGTACLAEDKHLPVYAELMSEFSPDLIAGGATQNSIRVAQWMLQTPKATMFLGSVGKDKFADDLSKACEKDGVQDLYYHSDMATGTCAVLIEGKERCLIANLSAANDFKSAHLDTPAVDAALQNAQVYYVAGFFLSVPEGPAAMLKVMEHAAATNKIFCMNISAPFLVQFFREPMDKALEYCDFVFCNEDEATEYGKAREWGTNLQEVALKLASLPKKNGARCRTVVFTQGASSTLVCHNGQITEFPVRALAKDLLVDLNGAGDAFVGGFLSQLLLGKEIPECVRAGHYASRVVIQRDGCTLPAVPDYQGDF